ncbi:MAG: hypothetical protein U5R14_13685 [Gemmatimonadota bacterium]|nr:hypothetical protein [Gemmatimonadota bacterium]
MPSDDAHMGLGRASEHADVTDPETGLANKLHFDLVYRYLFLAGDRGVAFTVMLISVDEPSAPEGRLPNQEDIANTIHRTTRAADLVAHVEQGRYAVLLLGTNLPGARIAADRLEAALREHSFGPPAIGLATFNPDIADSAELLRAAESALDAAHAAGGGVEMA